MGNWKLGAAEQPQTLTRESLASLRHGRAAGLSRRTLLRRSLGAGVALWLTEVPGRLDRLPVAEPARRLRQPGDAGHDHRRQRRAGRGRRDAGVRRTGLLPDRPDATSSSSTPARGFIPGESSDGSGIDINVRALYQRCPHLGCKPNFCTKNHWFECACHGSRYDRLGTKIDKLGPAPRSLDRFASAVSADGVLTVNTATITLGPLPIALGQPGLIPPTSPTGCI